LSHSARRKAQEDSFIPSEQLPQEIIEVLQRILPSSLTEDGEWVDLSEVSRTSGSLESLEMITLLRPL
jgi:hypothetical protein